MSECPSRALGSVEAGMAIGNRLSPLNMVTAVRLVDPPDVDALRRTIDDIQRRHPPLRSRIERVGRRDRFVYDVTAPIPLRIVERRDDGTWTREAERLLNTALPGSGPLASASLVCADGQERCELLLAYQHTIVDGVSAATVWGELLTGAAADATDATEPLPPTACPRSADELIPARWRGRGLLVPRLRFVADSIAHEASYRAATFRQAPGVDVHSRTQVGTHTFDAATTDRLNAAAHRRHCTLHSLLHAAVLQVVHTHRYRSRPRRMRTIAFADLRAHLDPRPAPHQLAPYVALTSQDVSIRPDDDIWTIAHAVQTELRASVKGGAKFVSYAFTRPLMRMATAFARQRIGTTAVSHTGPIRIAGSDGRVDGLHAFVSNLPIGPELSVRSGSFEGRLTLDMMSLDTDMDRDEFDALTRALVAVLDDVASPT